ncbi:hypothetical protein SSX86_007702 [Deinandra increscens subsp. villosa]|uniref:Integrase catalytic domain-containing protein n=1 Tax=Deinandra increscens subsp. villosa TaxID=3103831 RepID=A0AAP0H3B6_9ASTR
MTDLTLGSLNGSSNKPPIFTPDDFDTWKLRMEGFVRSLDRRIWNRLTVGPYNPTVQSADDAQVQIPKPLDKYVEADYAELEYDHKAYWILQAALPNSILVGFKGYKTAHSLWNALSEMYEGSSEVKENKKDVLKQRYENFIYKTGESMTNQYLRFVSLLDELQKVEVTIEQADANRKFLRSLPPMWTVYTVSIRECKDLKKLKLSELHGVLSAYEMELNFKQNSLPEASPQLQTTALVTTDFQKISISLTLSQECKQPRRDGQNNNNNVQQRSNHGSNNNSNQQPTQPKPLGNQNVMAAVANQTECYECDDFVTEFEPINHALMAKEDSTEQVNEIPEKVLENLCSPACIEQVSKYRKHNTDLIDEQTNSILETQLEDLLNKLTISRQEIKDAKAENDVLEIKLKDALFTCDKFQTANKKVEKLWNAAMLGKTGIGYNNVEPPKEYSPVIAPIQALQKECSVSLIVNSTTSSPSESKSVESSSNCEVKDASTSPSVDQSKVLKPKVSFPPPTIYEPKDSKVGGKLHEQPNPSETEKMGKLTYHQVTNEESTKNTNTYQRKMFECVFYGEKGHMAAMCKFNPLSKAQNLLKPKTVSTQKRSTGRISPVRSNIMKYFDTESNKVLIGNNKNGSFSVLKPNRVPAELQPKFFSTGSEVQPEISKTLRSVTAPRQRPRVQFTDECDHFEGQGRRNPSRGKTTSRENLVKNKHNSQSEIPSSSSGNATVAFHSERSSQSNKFSNFNARISPVTSVDQIYTSPSELPKALTNKQKKYREYRERKIAERRLSKTNRQCQSSEQSEHLNIDQDDLLNEDPILNTLVLKEYKYYDASGKPKTSKAWEISMYWKNPKNINGGPVAFGSAKGHITAQGAVSNGMLTFDKNLNLMFTEREAIVLKPGVNIPEELVLLRAPRREGLYILDLSAATPGSGIACFISKASVDESDLWHRSSTVLEHCVSCLKGKQHKTSFKPKTESSITQPLELLHMDLFGPTRVRSLGKRSYCFVIIDDFTRYTWVFFLKTKDETTELLKRLIVSLENQAKLKVKTIRSDNGTKFKNHVLNSFCEEKGILRQFSAPRTPQQNGVAERRNRTLIEAAREMLADSKLPMVFWAEAVNTACYVQNRTLIVKGKNTTAYELWRGREPNIYFFKSFSCPVTILITNRLLPKFDEKADEGYFVGYSSVSKAFRVYNKSTKIVEETINVTFNEKSLNSFVSQPEWLFNIDALTIAFNFTIDKPLSSTVQEQEYKQNHMRSTDDIWQMNTKGLQMQPTFFSSISTKPVKPYNAKKTSEIVLADAEVLPVELPVKLPVEVQTDPVAVESPVETQPENNFLVNFENNEPDDSTDAGSNDYTLEHLISDSVPSSQEPTEISEPVSQTNNIELLPQLNIPHNGRSHEFPMFIDRRVSKDHQRENIIGDLSAPVLTRSKSIDANICLHAAFLSQEVPTKINDALEDESWVEAMQEELFQINKQKVWELVDLPEGEEPIGTKWNVYVKQPPGFEDPHYPNRVCKLIKALYGLKQAPRTWYETLSNYLLVNGYKRGAIDKTLFVKSDGKDTLMVQIYVDDIIFGSSSAALCKEFEGLMQSKFEMSSMGELNFFLGLQVKQTANGIFLNQSKYIQDMLKRFDMQSVSTSRTPISTSHKLNSDLSGKPVDVHLYRAMIGSLLYLTASRPDIMFSVCLCARYHYQPKESHMLAVKRIFRYLKGQPKLGLWYPKNSDFSFKAYTDSDYAGCNLDKKSTTGGCQFLGERLVSWQCKKQTCVSTSTAEAEYIAASSCCSQVLWIQNQMLDYGIKFMETPILADNNSAISITNNPVQHSKAKHIDIRYHFIRDCAEKHLIRMVKVHTNQQLADLFTKAFDEARFFYLISAIGMMNFD